ncbi:condensin-2 complex subunit H2-like [Hylaeus anthracinus]|uniref:condensin-2 complex subunit H2-like n=1 Tax=Hylaeus anthracinus TaxID=313031 RepID=UPI0023BA245D|nr:condensin-2 complex subunit H2-like [Hylaeus anthracinus]
MVTLQDISIQLMKPAKDLADWKFPLSQVLEEYYALLEDPCSINFGEAALVLQNSTNVYVRRIECLFNEIGVVKQVFFGYEEEELKKSSKESKTNEKRVSKKGYIDFENFVISDLETNVGKNINKKNQFQVQKKVKLLSHRFTQLENNVIQLSNPIQVYDVLGEIIGKKYDFRCNQAVNTSGMLVDELTPYDFNCICSSRVQKGRNSLSSYSEPKTPGTGTSGYQSATSFNDNEFTTSIHEEFEDHNFSLQIDNVSVASESEIVEKTNMINEDHEISCANSNISQELHIEKIVPNSQHIQNKLLQDSVDIIDKNSSILNYKEINKMKRKFENESSEETTRVEEICQSDDKRNKKCAAINKLTNNHKQLGLIDEGDQLQLKEGVFGLQKRGNQSTKLSICSVDGINEFDWKPMPLIHGMKNSLFDNSTILKLPEYISLLETKFGSKKRKHFASKLHESECLTKFISYETELFRIEKRDFILQAKQKFKCLRKQELEDFIKSFNECLNETEIDNDNSCHEVTTDVTNDSLENNFIEDNTEEIMDRTFSPIDIQSQSTVRHNSFDISEKSSTLYNNSYEPSISDDLMYSLPDYQTLIEGKMKEIFEESNIATELDQTVARWHASLQQKLAEAEIRSTFRIHDYTSRIIDTLQAVDQKKINFDSVVHDKSACEVARYFLASLQLANTYDVEIQTKDSDSSIELTLLNNKKQPET